MLHDWRVMHLDCIELKPLGPLKSITLLSGYETEHIVRKMAIERFADGPLEALRCKTAYDTYWQDWRGGGFDMSPHARRWLDFIHAMACAQEEYQESGIMLAVFDPYKAIWFPGYLKNLWRSRWPIRNMILRMYRAESEKVEGYRSMKKAVDAANNVLAALEQAGDKAERRDAD